MRWEDQGTADNRRYTVVPRTLSFLLHEGHVLLLRGAPDKRLWANQLNGVGGHLEPDEDPLAGACREILEETGLTVDALALRAIVHIAGTPSGPGVLLFVFVGQTATRQVRSGREGRLAWYPVDDLPWAELVKDLRELLPRILASRPGDAPVYGHYTPDPTGRMTFHFR